MSTSYMLECPNGDVFKKNGNQENPINENGSRSCS